MNDKNPWFDSTKLFNYVKLFSFPRLAGTEGEKTAVNLTIDTFKKIGFENSQIQREPFEFSDFYSTTMIKLILVINLTFSLFILMFAYVDLFISLLIVGAGTILILLIIKGLRHPENPGFWGEYYGNILSSTNIFVKIPAKKLPITKAGNIIISAHLDSKSQTFKTYWRVFFYRIWLYSGIFLGGFLIALFIRTYTPLELNLLTIGIGMWVFTLLISTSNFFLLFINTQNESPGALDNASGMAVVFALSNYFKDHPLENFNLWFCQFSAEELGTMGSRIFVNNHEEQFVKGRIYHINLDMISCAGTSQNRVEYLKSYGVLPRKKIAPLLCRYLDKAALIENLQISGFHLSTGAHTDSVPFHLRKFDSVDIVTRVAGKFTHSKVDTPEKVDPKVLQEASLIIRTSLLMLDNDFAILCENKELFCEEL
ncbi:MAG: M28 family metallopeptidase [Candidatus Hermodarchaeota archaeon]